MKKNRETDNVILGNDCMVSTDTSRTGLNNNIIVCGSSGCGKTMSVAEPRLIYTHNSSLCVTLTKRRLVNKYKRVFADRGYNVWDLDMVHFENSNVGYDPLAYIHNDRDISYFAESIVKLDSNGKYSHTQDPYWQNAATSLLCAEIAMVRYMDPNATMADVLDFHGEIQLTAKSLEKGEVSCDEKFKMLGEVDPHHFAVQCWRSFSDLPFRTMSCVFSTLDSAIDYIFTPEVKKIMSAPQKIDFTRLASEKTILFVTTSPVDQSLQRFINIFYGQAFKQMFEYAEEQPDGILPLPVHILCDDFATGGRVPNFQEHISIFREKGISVSLLIQSETQLVSIYGEYDAVTIINNCDTYLFMGGMDELTNSRISKRLNVPFEDVQSMPVGDVYIFRRGQCPIKTQRYDIEQDKEYVKITDLYQEEIAEMER